MENSIRFSYREREILAIVKTTDEAGNNISYQSSVKISSNFNKKEARFKAFVKLINNARQRNVIRRNKRVEIARNFFDKVSLPKGFKTPKVKKPIQREVLIVA